MPAASQTGSSEGFEAKIRERIVNNGRNAENNNAGIRVGSDLHLCEMALAEIERLRGAIMQIAVISKPAPDVIAALKTAIAVADEARDEWDAARSGMKAGKLLIALSGKLPGYRADIDAIHAALAKALPIDPRDPDPSRPGIFRDHNCSRCNSGAKPCVSGSPNRCEYPHARND